LLQLELWAKVFINKKRWENKKNAKKAFFYFKIKKRFLHLCCRLRVQSPFIRAMGCCYVRCATCVIAGPYATSHCKPLLVMFM